MRLLHFDALDRLILTDFRSKSVPPYAILSHRWSDSETLIEDIRNESYKEREEGYQKLKFCAGQAAKDRLQYFWIDTCCIDRWDKDERSRAINSMFQWYRNAARCYVFLSDVSLSAVTETAACCDWESSFRKSEWFTRGWTLQELIAPTSVEFFSGEGRRIGDKASLEQFIHNITGIPLAALHNEPLDQFSTSERMRWADNRKTSEEEDIVYCLLGLLSISLPITYGEGKESARRRLQAEIKAAGSAPSIIPFSRNESFVGRESQLAELEAKLFSDQQTTTTLAIVGPGGTGKSQLALEVAHRVMLQNKDCSVFWIDASDIESLYRSYASVAQKLSIPGWDDDLADTKQVVKRCVVEVSMRQCLLIFDNVESTTVRSSGSSYTSEAALLTGFLPHSKLCSVIFTTTESDAAEALASQNVVVLRELTPDTALRMLRNCLTTPLPNAEQQGAMDLLGELLYLPLAVVQAAACMNASNMTVQQYRAQLVEHKEAALEYSDDPSEGELQESGLRATVAATLSLSMSQVRQSNAVAADYLFLAACVDRMDISLDLLVAASPQAREDGIKVLNRYALVIRRPAQSALDIHRLVHSALRKRLEAEGRLEEWIQRTTTQLLWLFPNNDHSNRSKWRRLLPHAQYVLSHTQMDEDEERLDLAWKCAMALHSDGQYREAEELFVQVMQKRKRVLGDEYPDTLTSMANLASTYMNQGRWGEAEELEVQVMQTRKRVLGDEHPDTLISMNNLAGVLYRQGKYKEAEAMHRQTLATSEKVLGREHPDTLMSMNNVALVLGRQGKYKEAEAMHRQTLATSEKVLGREHPHTLTSMGNLAGVLDSQGKHEEAEAMHRQELAMREKVLGSKHPSTLTSMNNLARVLGRQGKYKEAEAMHRQTLATKEKLLGREHPSTLTSMTNLAVVLDSQGKNEEAEAMHRQELAMREKVLGSEHASTLSSMNDLALVLGRQGKYKEAEAVHRQTLAIREKVLGRKHPDTLTSMSNLALVLDRQGKYEEAEAMHRQELAMCEKVLGREHPSTLTSMNNLAGVLARQGKYEEAEAMHRETVAMSEKVLGRKHPDTLTSVYCLAHLLAEQHEYQESLALYMRACDGYSEVLGDHHPTTRACRQHCSKVLASQAQPKVVSPTAAPDNGVSTPSRKVSRLSRGLAHLRIRSFKDRKG